MNKSALTFDITLDENKVPEKIEWLSSDSKEGGACKAAFISIWDDQQKNTLKIDLWTKDMLVDDMKMFYYQHLLTMAETFERATSDHSMSKDLKEFTRYFGEKMNLIQKNISN